MTCTRCRHAVASAGYIELDLTVPPDARKHKPGRRTRGRLGVCPRCAPGVEKALKSVFGTACLTITPDRTAA